MAKLGPEFSQLWSILVNVKPNSAKCRGNLATFSIIRQLWPIICQLFANSGQTLPKSGWSNLDQVQLKACDRRVSCMGAVHGLSVSGAGSEGKCAQNDSMSSRIYAIGPFDGVDHGSMHRRSCGVLANTAMQQVCPPEADVSLGRPRRCAERLVAHHLEPPNGGGGAEAPV